MDAGPIGFGLPYHPYADLFPLMEGEEYEALVADIKLNGLLHPIILLDGKILDGRNRYRACLDAVVKPATVSYSGPMKPLDYVISVNLKRRHLDEGQRSMIGFKVTEIFAEAERVRQLTNQLQNQTKRVDPPNPKRHVEAAAKVMNVSAVGIERARAVYKTGSPDLVGRVNRGEVAVSVAAKVARMPQEQQAKVVNLTEPQLRGSVKKFERAKRESDLGEDTRKASKALGSKLYNVIYADPPWSFEPYSEATGMDRAADNHYPTMSTEEICAIKVPATDDCVLFLWRTAPMNVEALEVMKAWGFTYRTEFIWAKDRIGTGYWNRNKHEVLMVGTRGHIPAPAQGEQFDSVIAQAKASHSAKPALFAEMIEQMFPSASLLEMFARSSRAGWDVWGNQSGGRAR